ncbi:MAG: hypothetical protein WCW40_01105 [Bacteroidota bacterium]
MNKFAAVVLMLFFSACKQEEIPDTSSLQPPTGIPFLTGSHNLYEWTFGRDSSQSQIFSTRDSLTVSVLSNSEQQFGYSNLTLMEVRSKKYPSGISRVWYRNANDSLTEVGYAGIGTVPFVMPKSDITPAAYSQFTLPYLVRVAAAQHVNITDSISKRSENRIVYHFPLTMNSVWISFRTPFLEKREVVGIEEIAVKAGRFICSKIKTEIYFGATKDTSLQWYDYVAREGLILRTLTFSGLYTSEQHPDSAFAYFGRERTELISYQ